MSDDERKGHDYVCFKCRTGHTESNMVAYCAACYAQANALRGIPDPEAWVRNARKVVEAAIPHSNWDTEGPMLSDTKRLNEALAEFRRGEGK